MKRSKTPRNSSSLRQKLRVLYITALCIILPAVALTPLLMYFGITNILAKAIAGNTSQPGVIVYEPGTVLPEGQAGALVQLPQTGKSLVLTSSPVVDITARTSGCSTDTSGYTIVHSWQRKGPSDSVFKTFVNIGRDVSAVYGKNVSVPTTESGLDSNYQYQVKYLVYRIDTKGAMYFVTSFISDVFQPNADGHAFVGPMLNVLCQ
jgi:hypothetical protein